MIKCEVLTLSYFQPYLALVAQSQHARGKDSAAEWNLSVEFVNLWKSYEKRQLVYNLLVLVTVTEKEAAKKEFYQTKPTWCTELIHSTRQYCEQKHEECSRLVQSQPPKRKYECRAILWGIDCFNLEAFKEPIPLDQGGRSWLCWAGSDTAVMRSLRSTLEDCG